MAPEQPKTINNATAEPFNGTVVIKFRDIPFYETQTNTAYTSSLYQPKQKKIVPPSTWPNGKKRKAWEINAI